jgi:hypothetical protein
VRAEQPIREKQLEEVPEIPLKYLVRQVRVGLSGIDSGHALNEAVEVPRVD